MGTISIVELGRGTHSIVGLGRGTYSIPFVLYQGGVGRGITTIPSLVELVDGNESTGVPGLPGMSVGATTGGINGTVDTTAGGMNGTVD